MIGVADFLRTILDLPDADAPRLVCADWLEERGSPHAELIRTQCELARVGIIHPRRESLQRRERELITRNEATWLAPIRELGFSARWRRGFLEVSVNGVRRFLDTSERIFANPCVLYVQLRDAAADVVEVAELTRSPYLSRIQVLDLSRSPIGNEGVRELAESRFEFQPTHLLLNHIGLTTTGLRTLIEELSFARLAHLQLQGNAVGAAGSRALSLSPRLSGLRVLDFSYNRLGTVGGEYLAESVYLGQLQSLNVVGNSIGARGVKALRRRFGKRVRLISHESFV